MLSNCWYNPPKKSVKKVKFHCEEIINELRDLHKEGKPLGLSLNDVKDLLDCLWDPEVCDEKRFIKCRKNKEKKINHIEGEGL